MHGEPIISQTTLITRSTQAKSKTGGRQLVTNIYMALNKAKETIFIPTMLYLEGKMVERLER